MIEVVQLFKRYGDAAAVKGVSFGVDAGQVVGLLGPNGAGKTTIMKILTGYHFPSAGTARVDGISVTDDPVEVKKRVGYLPENAPLYGDFTPREYLSFLAEVRNMAPENRARRIDSALDSCGLREVAEKRIETLSRGYRQRVGLAQAIVHDPPILILDEPTSGLDPNQILEIRALIRELGKSKTVILSTHIMQEVEAVCSRVLILNEGLIVAQGRVEEIAAGMKGGDTWELVLRGADPADIPERLAALAPSFAPAGLEIIDQRTTALRLLARAPGPDGERADGEALFDWVVAHNLKLIGMEKKRLSLEDIFVKLTTEGEGRDVER